jgi:hypothetical protein
MFCAGLFSIFADLLSKDPALLGTTRLPMRRQNPENPEAAHQRPKSAGQWNGILYDTASAGTFQLKAPEIGQSEELSED